MYLPGKSPNVIIRNGKLVSILLVSFLLFANLESGEGRKSRGSSKGNPRKSTVRTTVKYPTQQKPDTRRIIIPPKPDTRRIDVPPNPDTRRIVVVPKPDTRRNFVPSKKFPSPGFGGGGSGFKTLGKITLGTILLKQMTPRIGFTSYRGYDRNRRPTYCMNCISVNNSNPTCVTGGASSSAYSPVDTCRTDMFNSHCSTEYGRTESDEFFMRRSCNRRTCTSCDEHLRRSSDDQRKKCHILQCNVCNWNGCNSGNLRGTFPSDFDVEDDEFSGQEDDEGDRGGAEAIRCPIITIIALSASAYILLNVA